MERDYNAAGSGLRAPPPGPAEILDGQIVFVGSGRVGRHIGQVGIHRLVIEADASRARRLSYLGTAALLGDASGVSIVAIGRGHDVTSNPGASEKLHPGDRIAVIGSHAVVADGGPILGGQEEVEPVES